MQIQATGLPVVKEAAAADEEMIEEAAEDEQIQTSKVAEAKPEDIPVKKKAPPKKRTKKDIKIELDSETVKDLERAIEKMQTL